MGHQTNTTVCNKCGGITIKTLVGLSKKPIESSNCTCNTKTHIKTTQEVFEDVLIEFGFEGYKPKDLTNSDYYALINMSMSRYSNQFLSNSISSLRALKQEVDFKSKIYQVLFKDAGSSQEKIYELKQLFLNE